MSAIAPQNSQSNRSEDSIDVTLDLRGTPCPINFVRTKLQLQKMAAGQRLEVLIDPGEPTEQVPDSLAVAGFPVEELIDCGEHFVLRVCKPDSES
ncbi:MAG: sulfurtransferase TusA family protein [Cyanobacteria bacterium P01_C01_bin.89]